MKRHAFLLLVSFFVTTNTFAQDIKWDSVSAISTLKLFCDPGYISGLSGIGNMEPLMFEADIIPYYVIGINRHYRWGFALSPRVILRMYNTESYPVRTPSYMPRIILIHQVANHIKERDWFYYLSWFHHSNGQDGTFYTTDSITINTKNGSFSTNWIEGGMFLSRSKINRKYYLKINALYSYNQDKELNGIYGRLRFFADLKTEWNLVSKTLNLFNLSYFERNKGVLDNMFRFGLIVDDLKNTKIFDKKRFIFQYTLTYKPSFLRDVTFFAQYYYGSDYYNIYFYRTLKVLRFGIAAKTSIFN
jgi:hypothetical protein